MIDYMPVAYKDIIVGTMTFDRVGIFENNVLKKTFSVEDSKSFMTWAAKKKPKTVRGAVMLSTKFKKQFAVL